MLAASAQPVAAARMLHTKIVIVFRDLCMVVLRVEKGGYIGGVPKRTTPAGVQPSGRIEFDVVCALAQNLRRETYDGTSVSSSVAAPDGL